MPCGLLHVMPRGMEQAAWRSHQACDTPWRTTCHIAYNHRARQTPQYDARHSGAAARRWPCPHFGSHSSTHPIHFWEVLAVSQCRYATMAMFNMYKNFEYLCPDAPDTISQLLLTGTAHCITIATHCSRGAGARTLRTSTRPWRCCPVSRMAGQRVQSRTRRRSATPSSCSRTAHRIRPSST